MELLEDRGSTTVSFETPQAKCNRTKFPRPFDGDGSTQLHCPACSVLAVSA